jgi:hypothetical protein
MRNSILSPMILRISLHKLLNPTPNPIRTNLLIAPLHYSRPAFEDLVNMNAMIICEPV